MAEPKNYKWIAGLIPFALVAVFWAGSALSNSKTTGSVATNTVKEVSRIKETVSRHDTEIAVLKTNQEYIKSGIDDIKKMVVTMQSHHIGPRRND